VCYLWWGPRTTTVAIRGAAQNDEEIEVVEEDRGQTFTQLSLVGDPAVTVRSNGSERWRGRHHLPSSHAGYSRLHVVFPVFHNARSLASRCAGWGSGRVLVTSWRRGEVSERGWGGGVSALGHDLHKIRARGMSFAHRLDGSHAPRVPSHVIHGHDLVPRHLLGQRAQHRAIRLQREHVGQPGAWGVRGV
jgi:hypothetical protein